MAENSESCNGQCSSCASSATCDSKKDDLRVPTNEFNNIKKVIPIISGKGGVGKSLVTSLLAVYARRKGYKVGIMDADITGPSIPKMFGANGNAEGGEFGIYTYRTHNDIRLMSINLLLEDTEAPVLWRGPLIGGAVKQFWTDVMWGEHDYLFIDMPPGTGDVPLTVFQSLPVDGIIIVTSPQDLVSLIVKKAYNMAKAMHIPILGLVENMSYVKCPDCGKAINLFGESKTKKTAEETGLKMLGQIPIDPYLASLCDAGEIEKYSENYLQEALKAIEELS